MYVTSLCMCRGLVFTRPSAIGNIYLSESRRQINKDIHSNTMWCIMLCYLLFIHKTTDANLFWIARFHISNNSKCGTYISTGFEILKLNSCRFIVDSISPPLVPRVFVTSLQKVDFTGVLSQRDDIIPLPIS